MLSVLTSLTLLLIVSTLGQLLLIRIPWTKTQPAIEEKRIIVVIIIPRPMKSQNEDMTDPAIKNNQFETTISITFYNYV